MTQTLKKILIVLLVLLLSLGAQAQSSSTGWQVRISKIATLETPDAMDLKVYFSVYDPKTDQAVLDVKPQGVQIALPQSKYVGNALFQKPDVPIYIVLVLDASGSMGGATAALKNAAKQALDNSPDNSFFSVIQFNESIQLLQDFTQNIQAVSFAIDQYKSAAKGTCLYDATYSAVESLTKAPPGRRAIILFTDGKDEDFSGKLCSKHTFLEAADFAAKSEVPISTIGLTYGKGNINEVELKGLAASTGGYSAIGKQADLTTAFTNIMNGLKAQWMVDTNIYPKSGTNQVVLNLIMSGSNSLGTTFNVESKTDYPGPPSPVQGSMTGLVFKPDNQTYDIQLALTKPELVDSILVEIWDSKGGSKVAQYQFKNVQPTNTFNIPTGSLVVGRDYELRMMAVNKADQTQFNWVTTSDNKRLAILTHPFVFDPSANLPSLTIDSVSQVNNDLVLSIKTTNSVLVGGFNGWLVDKATNTQVPNSSFSNPPLNSTAGTITMPLSKARIPAGSYTAIINVLGKNNQVYSTASYDGIAYQPTLPNLIQLMTAALIAAPIVIILVILMIIGLVGFLMYTSSREKSMTGTPVLQGRLGNKPAAGPVIPIAEAAPPLNPDATFIPGAGLNDGATIIAMPPKMPAARLILVSAPPGIQPAGSSLVNETPFIIGRGEGSLTIPEASISRQHVRIDYLEASRSFTITDLKSSNGTRLNNTRVTAGQPYILVNGTLIGLGLSVSMRFELS